MHCDTQTMAILHGGVCVQPRKKQRREKTLKWPQEHDELARARGITIPKLDLSSEDYICFPGLTQMRQRELDVLRTAGLESLDDVRSYPGGSVELSPVAERVRITKSGVRTIVPGSRIFLMDRCRLLHPVEALHIQGIDVSEVGADRFSRATLQSLAGNAFDTHCCTVSLFTGLLFLSHNFSDRCTGRPRSHR